ncbi:hypothetical protein ABKV19_004011 [Rosa sericea]
MKFDLEIETRLGLRQNRISQPLKLAIVLIAPLYGKLVILKKYPLLRSLFRLWLFDLAAGIPHSKLGSYVFFVGAVEEKAPSLSSWSGNQSLWTPVLFLL